MCNMKLIFINLIIATAVLAQNSCKTPKQINGVCIPLENCPELKTIFDNKARSLQELRFLRNSACRSSTYVRNVQYVCCESPANNFQCTTPDLYNGTCKGFNNCPSAKLLMGSNKKVPNYITDYFKESICQSSEKYSICCSDRAPCVSHIKTPHQKIMKLLPEKDACGHDSTTDRIVGGTEAGMGEFPWAILIEYKKNDTIHLGCGGSLISNRYVLTAAHCVVGNILRSLGNPINIRLGEHDTNNPGSDCVWLTPSEKDCDEGTKTIPVEKVIPHPCYENNKLHDIALIRMVNSVEFTDFISPVCLPDKDITLSLKSNNLHIFTVVGWGTTEKAKSSNVKLFAELPFSDLVKCQRAYRTATKLINNQLCAGGVKGYDSCRGDSGGPLLSRNSDQYDLVGVVSFGPTPCGKDGIPGVYTKVWAYIDWIKGEIEP